ncbi:MAG: L-threonylcarbamoyladenylate synthase [Gemmatimonadota bacterium]
MIFRETAIPDLPSEREKVIEAVSRRLETGELLVHPTSTLYGIGAAHGAGLDEEILRLKQKPPGSPLLRLAPSVETVRSVRPKVEWDERAEKLADRFWPGSLTLVLEDGTAQGLAVRVDGHPVVRAILSAYGGLMISTSVNRAGQPASVSPGEVRELLADLPDASVPLTFVNAGPVTARGPSTILSLRSDPARLLRLGAVETGLLESCLGAPVLR